LLLSATQLCAGEIALGAVVLILDPEVDLDPAALPPAVFKQYQSPIETACLHSVPFGTLEQKDSGEITQLNTHCGAVFSGSSC
jgi:hypothetical protein